MASGIQFLRKAQRTAARASSTLRREWIRGWTVLIVVLHRQPVFAFQVVIQIEIRLIGMENGRYALDQNIVSERTGNVRISNLWARNQILSVRQLRLQKLQCHRIHLAGCKACRLSGPAARAYEILINDTGKRGCAAIISQM